MPSILPPTDLRVIRSGYVKSGRWVNVLKWRASPTPDVNYLITRNYLHEPLGFNLKDRRAIIQNDYYLDENPSVGVPTFYSVYTCRDGKINRRGINVYAGIRRDEIHNLKVIRENSEEVKLFWNSPNNMAGCIISRAYGEASHIRKHSEGIIVSKQHGSAIDYNVPNNSPVYYTVWGIFRDPVNHKHIFSSGVNIFVPPFSTQLKVSVDQSVRMIQCALCDGLLSKKDEIVECVFCGALYHLVCWNFLNEKCGVMWCPSTSARSINFSRSQGL